jgi:DNA polymerase-1
VRVVCDIETDSLTPSVIWVIVTKDIDTGEVYTHISPFSEFRKMARSFTRVVGHNFLGFDIHAIRNLLGVEIDPDIVVDTAVVSRFLNFDIDGGHSLAAWGQRLGCPKYDFHDFSKLSAEMIRYCKQDVEVNYKLYKRFERYIDNDRFKRALNTEHQMSLICNEIRDNGFFFNKDKALEYKAEIEAELEKLDADIARGFTPRVIPGESFPIRVTKTGRVLARIRNLAPDLGTGEDGSRTEYAVGSSIQLFSVVEFNPASPKQIVERLNEAGWKPVDKTKGHIQCERELKRCRDRVKREELKKRLEEYAVYGWKVNEENLETLPDTAPPAAKSLAKRILLASRLSSLTEWLNGVREDGRIHGNLFHIGAWTGRMSHDHPNTANIPSKHNRKGQVALYGAEFRSLWCVPKGRRLVGVDAEGIQLRVLAHYINDERFTHGLVRGDKADRTDIHSLNAALLSSGVGYGVSRDVAKTFIYSWLLGAGEGKTAEVLGCTLPAARSARGAFVGGYPGLEALKNDKIPCDASRGYFEGLDGRYVVCDSEHLMLAGYLQNGEAVVMKMANIRWRSQLIKERVPFWQVNFVHDEWQTETIDDDDVANYIKQVQAQAIVDVGIELGLNCPLAGSGGSGYNWLETH